MTYRGIPVALAFLATAAAGFVLSRAGLVDLKFAAMNPIRDRTVLERIAGGTQSLDETRRYLTRGSETAAETLCLPPVAVLKVLSLGHRTALSDLLFVRAHAYFLSHFFADRIFAWLELVDDAMAAVERDNASLNKKGGEFYTPRCIVRLLVEMLEPYRGRVYNPCCGSSGMFVQSEEFIRAHGGRIGDISIYGQELNSTTWRLAKMNLAIRGIDGWIEQPLVHRVALRYGTKRIAPGDWNHAHP